MTTRPPIPWSCLLCAAVALGAAACGASDEIATGFQSPGIDGSGGGDALGRIADGLAIGGSDAVERRKPAAEDAPVEVAADTAVVVPDAVAPDASGGEDAGSDVADAPAGDDYLGADAGMDTGPACPADHCLIDALCIANLGHNPANACELCVVIADPVHWTAADAGNCDDGDACTIDDQCWAGLCAGAQKQACDDANPCTDDACAPADGACLHLPNAVTCDDGNACTVADACQDSACAPGTALACSDGNPCTDDTCEPTSGCAFPPNVGPCDDGDLCTSGDACKDTTCLPGAATPCDDADACTVDGCDPKSGCVHTSIAALCADTNPCTDEACDPKAGCVFPFNTASCDDGNACTTFDTCTLGACLGASIDPDDANPCTDDTCDVTWGVSHTPNGVACDDLDACTLGDVCKDATCAPGPTPLGCDDGNACTDDGCDPKAGCTHVDNTIACDDGDACTENDACAVAACAGVTVDCDDGNACTTDSGDTKAGCKHVLIVSNACRPLIEVTYPPRGATIQSGTTTVVVKGKVTSGAGPITAFTLNTSPVTLDADGTFTFPVDAKVGGNTLVFEAKDSFDSGRKRVQAFLWSSTYFKPDELTPKSGMVDPGLAYFLGQQAIDDGNHSLPPNDLATIFELYLANFDLNALLPSPAYENGQYKVYLKNLTYAKPVVTLQAETGGMLMTATMASPKADIDAKGKVWYIPSFSGKLTMSSIVVTTHVVPSVVDHALLVKMINTTVALNDISVKVDGIFGWLISPLVTWLVNSFKASIQDSFQSSVVGALEPALGSALGALAVQFAFDVSTLDGSGGKVHVDVTTDFSAVAFEPKGGEFDLRAAAYSKKATPYDNLGVPGRIDCGAPPQTIVVPKASPLELIIADDAFNELLYANWRGGLFEFPVPPGMLGDVDLSSYGISDLALNVSAMLAPTVDDCNPSTELRAHIGDFRIDANMKLLGQPVDVILWVTFVAGVEISSANDGISITLKDVKSVDTEIQVQQDNLVSAEGAIASLVSDKLIGNLVAALGGSALGNFPLPVVDLSKTVAGLPPGTGIAINPQSITRQGGNTIVGGTLK